MLARATEPGRHRGSTAARSGAGLHSGDDSSDDELEADELRAMEMEGDALLHKLKNDLDEVREVERKMAELGQLMETFSDKVLEQQETIEYLKDAATQGHAHVQQANRYIHSAGDSACDLRLIVVGIMLMTSALLLVVDAYS
eukprot:PLAT3179.1.p2 GENE.PLAT3179.1~~PLAT3179.1.p2  ORF type:complete len:142 (+),score=69.96 PLAT3179.1:583-1008(+)